MVDTNRMAFRADSRVRVRSHERMEMLMERIRENSAQVDDFEESRNHREEYVVAD